MSDRRASVLVTLCLLPLAGCTSLGLNRGPAAPEVPAPLTVGSGERLVLVTPAKGAQTYECRAQKGGRYAWVAGAPEATLFDADGNKIGLHYAGPSWEIREGGKVVGAVKAEVAAPDPAAALPWQLLTAQAHEGEGLMTTVSSIQRLDTRGGLPPAAKACSQKAAGKKVRVDFGATYYFYAAG
ncbi:uncharacterized protein DUF3455 [Plasticicumulans lactativorans]|uniref:Uncharacterized protein DUF3455 n=1 Tax=Plasticicumulans lactativorans TaxID=1133106 RepID=A0A4R2L992_9GAMM|nr:DUF3455 domain-containing protein [Plasticicumulans lactativorans]TCO82725.1 uncharacterized protein DUF3455 [Plasticicumulans lactativorans]